MCDKHIIKSESFITPIDSKFLTSKLVVMHKGGIMPKHTTGPDKEEVIICLNGSIKVQTDTRRPVASNIEWRRKAGEKGATFYMYQGEVLFLPSNTEHSVTFNNVGIDHAIYVYVVNKVGATAQGSTFKTLIEERLRMLYINPPRKSEPVEWCERCRCYHGKIARHIHESDDDYLIRITAILNRRMRLSKKMKKVRRK